MSQIHFLFYAKIDEIMHLLIEAHRVALFKGSFNLSNVWLCCFFVIFLVNDEIITFGHVWKEKESGVWSLEILIVLRLND